MFDREMVLTHGFQNVIHNGERTGFQLTVRIVYPYRGGLYLALADGLTLKVNGESFAADDLQLNYSNKTYAIKDLAKLVKLEFGSQRTAILIAKKPGGLKPGIHQVEVAGLIKPPPSVGLPCFTKRKITLVV